MNIKKLTKRNVLSFGIFFCLDREYELIGRLINALKEHDREQFSQARLVFSEMQPLDGWRLKLLIEIEESI